MPSHSINAKGFAGRLVEEWLGASAGSLAEPDFQIIGVELKTIPVGRDGRPRESTYVCTVPLESERAPVWSTSVVRHKLARVLWIPIVTDPAIPVPRRLVGSPVLWTPSTDQEAALRADWEELMDMVCMGELETITARHGTCLQIRPKAANARARRWGIGESGDRIRTLPRGFYLRPAFTHRILRDNYLLS